MWIVRKDKTKDFCPENCAVMTPTESHYVQRNCIKVDGEPLHKLFIEHTDGNGNLYCTVSKRYRSSQYCLNDAIETSPVRQDEISCIGNRKSVESRKPARFADEGRGFYDKRRLYPTWQGMKRACGIVKGIDEQVRMEQFGNIGMMKEWANDYFAFELWAIENGWKKGMKVARVDKDKGFFPDNLKIVDNKTALLMRRCGNGKKKE